MKRMTLLLLFSVALVGFCFSQNKSIEDFYTKHQSLHNEQEVEKEITALVKEWKEEQSKKSEITSYRIIEHNGDSMIPLSEIKALTKVLQADQFDEIVRVADSGASAWLLTKDGNENSLSEVFFIGQDDFEFVMISLSGNINFAELMASGINFSFNHGNKRYKAKKE